METNEFDFRNNKDLSAKDARRLDQLSGVVRREYDAYIGEFIQANDLTKLQLLLTASCRNTLVSNIHKTFCRIALLEEKIEANECPELIFVDSSSMARVVGGVLDKHRCENVTVVVENKERKVVWVILSNLCKSFYTMISSYCWSRYFSLRQEPLENIVFVDTFMLLDSVNSEGHFIDRYYTGHEVFLTTIEKEALWFAPTLYGVRSPGDYYQVFKRILSADRRFLIKEAWLTAYDYLYSFYFAILIPFGVGQYPNFRGINVSTIVEREVICDIGAPSLFRALCQFRFVRRLSMSKVKIGKVINWYENQVNDRALNLAFKKYFPNIEVVGYQGFVTIENYASLQPTSYELEAGTLPDVIKVINTDSKEALRSVCPDLKVEMSPAFRFSHVFNKQDNRPAHEKIVLISLPGSGFGNESIGMVRSYLSIADRMDNNVRVLVKLHPSYTERERVLLFSELQYEKLSFVKDSISDLLERASVMISTASSVCVEAVAVGVPVCIYGSLSGVTMNPIPSDVPNKLWCVFYTSAELEEFIHDSFQESFRESIANEIFYPIGERATRDLFVLSG